MKKQKAPFTLVEVLVTIAIIVILAGILIGGIGFATRRADEAKTFAQLETVAAAIEAFRADRGYYPQTNGADMVVTITRDGDDVYLDAEKKVALFNRKTKIPYLKGTSGELLDAWGNPLLFRCPGTHNPAAYDLWSRGPDGNAANTSDDDIGNWNNANK